MTAFDTPIFSKTYELYKTFYGYLASFPRKDRYTIGQRCEVTLLDLIETIAMAGNITKQEKLPVLKKASTRLDLLKVLFKLCNDLKIIDNKKYAVLDSQILEIGKMLGGWIRTTTQN